MTIPSDAEAKKVAHELRQRGHGATANRQINRTSQRLQQQSTTVPATASAVAASQSSQATESIDGAVRLMSETAHDLRSPLTTVRESIRLVRDGDVGEVNAEQAELLRSAMDQCDCMEQLVGEMLQLERLRKGAPRADRQWVSLEKIRDSVDETLQPWTLPHQIDLLWDVTENQSVYADASMIRRLIVNLVVNAIRASQDGQFVLIRFSPTRDKQMIQCQVIDQGDGIDAQDLRKIANQRVSLSGGEGLGLTICRQLAAVHFSSLEIRSKLGEGTQVSFELPSSGPHSVATAWVRWRQSIKTPLQRPQRRSESVDATDGSNKTVRMDPPSVSVAIQHCDTKPRFHDSFAVCTVSLGAAVSRAAADHFGAVLDRELRMFDFAYRIDTRRWVCILDADNDAVGDRIEAINEAAASGMDGVRSTWSPSQVIPVDGSRAAARLSDLIVRQSLSAATWTHVLGQDEVRPGTKPIGSSEAAALRLDEEIRRMSNQMRSQTTKLREQSQNLRPRL